MKIILISLIIMLCTAIFVHEYIKYNTPSQCVEGMVIDSYVSDRIVYLDGSMSDNWQDDENEYFVFMIRSNGKFELHNLGRGDLAYFRARMLQSGTKVSCKASSKLKYNEKNYY